MAVNVKCPHCKDAMAIDSSLLGSSIECPQCGERFDVPDKVRSKTDMLKKTVRAKGLACPACKKTLPPKSVFCTHCGFDLKLRRKLKSSFVADRPAAARGQLAPAQPAVSVAADTSSVTWRDIFATPFDLEMTLTETIELTMWSVFWVGLFAVMIGALVFLGMGSIFLVAGVIAGVLRFWMIQQDLSIVDLLKIVVVLLLFSTAVAYPVNLLLPNDNPDVSRIPALTFEIVILTVFLCVFLRMVSFFFGRYFAVVRRATFRTMFSEDDRGGLIDLGYAVGVAAISFLPLTATLVSAVGVSVLQGNDPGELEGTTRLAFIAIAAMAILWSMFYLPMAMGVVALRHSVRPGIVFQWIGKTLPDYLLLICLLLPFYVAIGVLSGTVGLYLARLGSFTRFGYLIEFGYAALAGVVLSQYAMTVTCVSVGLLVRKHEPELQWRRWADQH